MLCCAWLLSVGRWVECCRVDRVGSHFSVVLRHRGLCQGEREPGGWRVATIYNNHHTQDQQLPRARPSSPNIPTVTTIPTFSTIPITTPLDLKSGLQGKSDRFNLKGKWFSFKKIFNKKRDFLVWKLWRRSCETKEGNKLAIINSLVLYGTGFTTIGNRFIIFVVAETCTLQSKFISSNTGAVETLSWKIK